MAWNKDDWQQFNMTLASRFHRGAFQQIPDKHLGDGGLEGFSKDDLSVGYQCYVPDEDAETSLSDRIIDKINKDTYKLKANEVFFGKCLGSGKLRRWTLLVPKEYFRDRAIVEHAGKRADVVKSWNLPFINNDFCITVGSGDEFDAALQQIKDLGKSRIDINEGDPTAAQQVAWESANAENVPVLDNKLSRTNRPKLAIDAIREELIKCAVTAQNAFKQIEDDDPEGWERLMRAKSEKSRALRSESAWNTKVPAEFLAKVTGEYKLQIIDAMPSISESTALILTNEAVVEWLLTCPLEFYSAE